MLLRILMTPVVLNTTNVHLKNNDEKRSIILLPFDPSVKQLMELRVVSKNYFCFRKIGENGY